MGVGVVPLDDPDAADCRTRACDQARVSRPCGYRTARAATKRPATSSSIRSGRGLPEARTPFVLHVGGAPLQMNKAWSNNGRAPTKDWLGGGENVRSKDIAVLHEGPETFLSMMVIDGVFERFPAFARRQRRTRRRLGAVAADAPRLGGRALEQGRQNLANFKRKPSEQLPQQCAFTPVRVRRRRHADRPVEPGSIPVLQRLSAHRRRPQSDRALRTIAGRARAAGARQVLFREFPAHLPGRAGAEPGRIFQYGD